MGCSRLSLLHWKGTRARFQCDLAEGLSPAFEIHHGGPVKTMGDGLPPSLPKVWVQPVG
ncbi:hypothetical protein [Rhizobium subbaraonis]|uniref:hypothetical protein n=1 Tax=Rhizobium subbaraonis TaxID=908946 RepID=UPI001596E17D|nr:hypothetical protein [Rhizobium subbaraonis]